MESFLTEPRPVSATQVDEIDEFDARFADARERLVRICRGLVGVEAADDVVQDAYIRGRIHWRNLRDKDLFEAWLTRIAINLCLDRHRSRRRLRDLLPFLTPPTPTSARRDLGLRELIERLPPRERTLVVLHYGYGYRLEEIAVIVGLSPINVRTIVFRARRRLRDQLGDEDR